MKFLTLKGREVKIQIQPSQYPLRSRETSRSAGQYHLGRQLATLYENIVILEEFGIPDSRLSLDFYVPTRKLALEFQGEQHDEYNTFFHNSKADFTRQKERDSDKRRWCELNEIRLIEVRDNKISLAELKKLIHE